MTLLLIEGRSIQDVAEALDLCEPTVRRWAQRFRDEGLPGLEERPRPGQPQRLTADSRRELLRRSLREVPGGRAAWSIRSLASAMGVTQHQVRRLWKQVGISKHRLREGREVAAELASGRARIELLFVSRDFACSLFEVDAGATPAPLEPIPEDPRLVGRRRTGSLFGILEGLAPSPMPAPSDEALALTALEITRRALSTPRGQRQRLIVLRPLPGEQGPALPVVGADATIHSMPTFDAWLFTHELYLRWVEAAREPTLAAANVLALRTAVIAWARESTRSSETSSTGFLWTGPGHRSRVRSASDADHEPPEGSVEPWSRAASERAPSWAEA